MCSDRRRARRTAPALLEVAMQSAFQENCLYTIAVRGLLDGGLAMVRRMGVACRWRLQLLSPIRQQSRCLVCPYHLGL